MSEFALTKKAKSDLKSIAIYTQKTYGKDQRNLYLSIIDKAFYDLANNPQKGVSSESLRKGYFKFYVGKHVIFYHKINSKLIEIVRILHGRMDIEAHL